MQCLSLLLCLNLSELVAVGRIGFWIYVHVPRMMSGQRFLLSTSPTTCLAPASLFLPGPSLSFLRVLPTHTPGQFWAPPGLLLASQQPPFPHPCHIIHGTGERRKVLALDGGCPCKSELGALVPQPCHGTMPGQLTPDVMRAPCALLV